MNISVLRKEDVPRPDSQQYYFLHREMILREIKAVQEQRGVQHPSYYNAFRLSVVANSVVMLCNTGRKAQL